MRRAAKRTRLSMADNCLTATQPLHGEGQNTELERSKRSVLSLLSLHTDLIREASNAKRHLSIALDLLDRGRIELQMSCIEESDQSQFTK